MQVDAELNESFARQPSHRDRVPVALYGVPAVRGCSTPSVARSRDWGAQEVGERCSCSPLSWWSR